MLATCHRHPGMSPVKCDELCNLLRLSVNIGTNLCVCVYIYIYTDYMFKHSGFYYLKAALSRRRYMCMCIYIYIVALITQRWGLVEGAKHIVVLIIQVHLVEGAYICTFYI